MLGAGSHMGITSGGRRVAGAAGADAPHAPNVTLLCLAISVYVTRQSDSDVSDHARHEASLSSKNVDRCACLRPRVFPGPVPVHVSG